MVILSPDSCVCRCSQAQAEHSPAPWPKSSAHFQSPDGMPHSPEANAFKQIIAYRLTYKNVCGTVA